MYVNEIKQTLESEEFKQSQLDRDCLQKIMPTIDSIQQQLQSQAGTIISNRSNEIQTLDDFNAIANNLLK